MDKVKMTTPDGVTENIEKLAALFPAAVTEMRGEDGTLRKGIDFEKLKQLLSRDIVEGGERYEFSWVGKKAAMAEAARPTTETLRPVKADSRDWDTTENLYIEGDNLAALKVLQESYLGKVKMIYIDPPYNTGSDNFVYPDSYTMDEEEYEGGIGLYSFDGKKLFKENNIGNPRFHSDWCSMIYSRLLLAKNLLSTDGVICIQIDDNEVENLKKICDEVFGIDNFMTTIVVKMSEATGMKMAHADMRIPKLKEYILVYTNGTRKKLGEVSIPKDKWDSEYKTFLEGLTRDDVSFLKAVRENEERTLDDIRMCDKILSKVSYISLGNAYKKYNISESEQQTFNFQNAWRIVQTVSMTGGAKQLADEKKERTHSVFFSIVTPQKKMYFIKGDYSDDISKPRIKILFADDYLTVNPCDFWQDIKTTGLDNEGFVDFRNGKKPLRLVERLIKLFTGDNDTVLDFFAGSGTTGQAVMEFNIREHSSRKFILVQLPENLDTEATKQTGANKKETEELIRFLDSIHRTHFLSEIGKERIRRAGDKIKTEHPDADLDIGFRVFRVDSSNMRDVYYKPEEFTQTMLGEAVSNIKPDRTDLDLLYACLLDCGVPIHLPHTTTTVDGCTIHNVDNGALMACFDEHIPHSVIRAMAAETPLQVIFRDSAFAADADKINVTEIFKNLSPDTKVRVI